MPTSPFAEVLPAHLILTSPDDLAHYGRDWLTDFTPRPSVILFPETEAQVQAVVRTAVQRRIPLVPSGGRTGLSGGATAMNGEAVLSLARMNKILEVSEIDRTLRCQAGVVTQRVQEEARSRGMYFPVDFASKGSSHIGGNVATNAGGIRVLRYGNIRDWVVGMKAVDGRGDLHEFNGSLFKNQTGYDLKSLMIGSEGTLGIITELTMKLTSLPGEVLRALIGITTLDEVLPLLRTMRGHTPQLSVFEFFTANALDKVLSRHKLRYPLEGRFPYYVVVEIEHAEATREQDEQFLIGLLEKGAFGEVAVSQNSQQADEILALRERIAETVGALHVLHKNDISVPVPSIPEFVVKLQAAIAKEYPGWEVVIFGHIGDGNLHVNVLKPTEMENTEFFRLCHGSDTSLFSIVRDFNGSISAEHGVGLLKKDFLSFSRTPAQIELMRGVKKVFDPAGILNPGKIF